jgi:hypothetical protein
LFFDPLTSKVFFPPDSSSKCNREYP